MREYYITFESLEGNEILTCVGHGYNGQEAVRELMAYASVLRIIEVRQVR